MASELLQSLAPPAVAQRARELLANLPHDKLDQENNAQKHAAALVYIAAAQLGTIVDPIQLAQKANTKPKDFFYDVEDMNIRTKQPGNLPQLKTLKANFIVSTVAAKKFADLFPVLFPSNLAHDLDGQSSREFAWNLFLVAKMRCLPAVCSLMDAFELLTLVLQFLLAHLPASLRTATVWSYVGDLPFESFPFPPAAEKAFYSDLKCTKSEISRLGSRFTQFITELRSIVGGKASADGSGIASLLTDSVFVKNSNCRLSDTYVNEWKGNSSFNEQPLLEDVVSSENRAAVTRTPTRKVDCATFKSHCLPAPPSHSGMSAQNSLLTPLRGVNPLSRHIPKGTPISREIESVSWFRDAVANWPSPKRPHHELLSYFKACENDPSDSIARRLVDLSSKVHAYLLSLKIPEEEATDRVDLTARHYQKMLLTFLKAEEERLNKNKFDILLASEQFHISLFACCAEAMLASFFVLDSGFPVMLEMLKLPAFDFGKVISSFILHEPSLPSNLRVHFAKVEAMILESLAWADDSPLHSLTAEYEARQALQSAQAEGGRATGALELFFRKVFYLAAARIQEMCTRMLLHSSLVHQVWECLKVIIDTKLRYLLRGRHIDQIIMCTIYGVCKLNKQEFATPVTFKHIIEHYKRLQPTSSKVFREVRMATTDDPSEDIICFYNRIFIPAIKDELMRICKEDREATRFSDASRNIRSPQRVTASRDVYLSHPRTPSAASMTPKTKTLYAFSDSPAVSLRHGEQLSNINSQLNNLQSGTDVACVRALRQLSSTPPHLPNTASALSSQAPSSPTDSVNGTNGTAPMDGFKRRLDEVAEEGGSLNASPRKRKVA